MLKKWVLKSHREINSGNHDLRIKQIFKILLENRGLETAKEVKEFIDPPPPWSEIIINQVGVSKQQLSLAVLRIRKAIEAKEKIVVYGDYDADGVCATAVVWEALHKIGANVMPFIPSRGKHGYGLSRHGIDEIFENQKLLIITVDNGIVAHKAIEYASGKGIDVIVTDHHQKGKTLPKAEAIIWSDKLAGVGVAWILAKELINDTEWIINCLDLVAVGTIADLMPLVGPNRSVVKYGLERLNKTSRIGLQALLSQAGLKMGKIGTYEVGYIIAPRLNAMGRLDTALDSLRLLCTKKRERADTLAIKLGATNKERQDLTLSTFENVINRLADKAQNTKLIIIAHESFNQGVIGLVAGKLVEKFYKPTIVITKEGTYSKASVRSVKGFNIIEFLRKAEGFFEAIGGHPMAAGFTVKTDKISALENKLQEMAERELDEKILTPSFTPECIISLDDVSRQLFQRITDFEPFGMGNPQPLFVSKKIEITSFRQMGVDGKHLKITFGNLDGVFFGHGNLAPGLVRENYADIVYAINENVWNGNSKIQLMVKDMRIHSSCQEADEKIK